MLCFNARQAKNLSLSALEFNGNTEECLRILYAQIKLAASLGFSKTKVSLTPRGNKVEILRHCLQHLSKNGFKLKLSAPANILILW